MLGDSYQNKLREITAAAVNGDFSVARDLIPLFDASNYKKYEHMLGSPSTHILRFNQYTHPNEHQVRNVAAIVDLEVRDFGLLDALRDASALLLYSGLAPLQDLRALEGPLLHENSSLREEALKASSVGGGLLSLFPVFMEAWEKSEGCYEFEMAELAICELLGSEDLREMVDYRSSDAEFFDLAFLNYEKLLGEYGSDAIVWRGKLLDHVAVFQEYEREHRNPHTDTLIRRIQMWTGKSAPEKSGDVPTFEETLELLSTFEVGKRYFHRLVVP